MALKTGVQAAVVRLRVAVAAPMRVQSLSLSERVGGGTRVDSRPALGVVGRPEQTEQWRGRYLAVFG